jgi:hypothetical protein
VHFFPSSFTVPISRVGERYADARCKSQSLPGRLENSVQILSTSPEPGSLADLCPWGIISFHDSVLRPFVFLFLFLAAEHRMGHASRNRLLSSRGLSSPVSGNREIAPEQRLRDYDPELLTIGGERGVTEASPPCFEKGTRAGGKETKRRYHVQWLATVSKQRHRAHGPVPCRRHGFPDWTPVGSGSGFRRRSQSILTMWGFGSVALRLPRFWESGTMPNGAPLLGWDWGLGGHGGF